MDDRGALEPSAYEEARAKLFGFVEAGAEEADLPTFAAAVDTFRAEVRAEGLSESERTFLSFALGLAADVMASRGDEFTVEDEAALTSLRAMATSAPALVESAGDETGEPLCRCGHSKDRHAPDVYGAGTCGDCPGGEGRSWRHAYTPDAGDETGEAERKVRAKVAADFEEYGKCHDSLSWGQAYYIARDGLNGGAS